MSLLHSLRARLFAAIGLIVALSVAVALVLGLVLTRRAVEDATLKDLGHQAALIVGEERNALSPLTHLPQLRPYLARQHERYLLDTSVLPEGARRELSAGRPVTGTVSLDGTAYYYAAEPVGRRAFILLRPKSLTTPRWTPFVEAIVIAALVGGLLAAGAAFFLARRIVRPVARVAAASRSLAAGRRPEPVPVEGAAELETLGEVEDSPPVHDGGEGGIRRQCRCAGCERACHPGGRHLASDDALARIGLKPIDTRRLVRQALPDW